MGNVYLEVAQVLEDAADLYESEQVDWCSGSWVKAGVRLSLETEEVTSVFSMCAEGALMMAAGLNTIAIHHFQADQQDDELRGTNPAAYDLFSGARAVVATAVGGCIPTWNDEMVVRAKERVIDKFREVAKDIRNNAPAEDL